MKNLRLHDTSFKLCEVSLSMEVLNGKHKKQKKKIEKKKTASLL
jgi:hypothetical protein